MTEATDYAEGVRRTSVGQFEKRGGSVVAEERFSSDVTDFRTQPEKLFVTNPDALHIAPQSEFSASAIIKQSRELGYEGPSTLRLSPSAQLLWKSPETPRPA